MISNHKAGRKQPMSTQPRLETRVSIQERRQINLEAQVEELSGEITTSFKLVAEYFDRIENRLNKIETDIADTKTTLNQHTNRFDNLEKLLSQVLERLPKNEK